MRRLLRLSGESPSSSSSAESSGEACVRWWSARERCSLARRAEIAEGGRMRSRMWRQGLATCATKRECHIRDPSRNGCAEGVAWQCQSCTR